MYSSHAASRGELYKGFVRQATKPRPYRTWGYPIIPLVFIVVNLAIFLNSIFSQPFESALGLAIILAGVPAYVFWRKRKRSRRAKSSYE